MTTESVESSVRQKIRKKSVHYDASKNKKRSRKESLSMKSPLTRENRFGFIDCEEGNSTLDSMEEKYVVNSVIPTADIESIISQSLESHFLFAEFTSKAIKRFISKMKCERFDPGVNICQQGQYGQKFYIVAKGSVEIIKNGVTAETINVGGNFGDVALLHRCARVYTAISIGNVELWSIQSKPFREILKQNQSTKLSQIGDFLRKNKLFTSLNENQIAIATLTSTRMHLEKKNRFRGSYVFSITELELESLCSRKPEDSLRSEARF